MRNPFKLLKKSFEPLNDRTMLWTVSQMVDGIFPSLTSGQKGQLIKAGKGTVYACMSFIANDSAKIPLRLYTTAKLSGKSKVNRKEMEFLRSNKSGVAYRIKAFDEVEEVYEHESLKLLWDVNKYSHGTRLTAQTMAHLALTGDAYWYIIKGVLKPIEIHVMQPEDANIIEGKGFREIEKYQFGNTKYEPDEIIHFTLTPGPSAVVNESAINDYTLGG